MPDIIMTTSIESSSKMSKRLGLRRARRRHSRSPKNSAMLFVQGSGHRPAAEAVGRDFVAVVIDGDLRPVGTLMGTADAKEIAAGIPVGDVMGPTPTSVEGETATVGDVAVICAAAALDEPVAVVDAAGRLTRVVRREDLLRNPRETRNEGLGVQGGGESAR